MSTVLYVNTTPVTCQSSLKKAWGFLEVIGGRLLQATGHEQSPEIVLGLEIECMHQHLIVSVPAGLTWTRSKLILPARYLSVTIYYRTL